MGGAGTAARARRWTRGGPLILALLALAAPAHAAPELVEAGDFEGPTYAAGAPGDASRVFVTEKPGRVRVIRDGAVLAQPFLDVTANTSSSDEERGLLSLLVLVFAAPAQAAPSLVSLTGNARTLNQSVRVVR